MIFLLRRRTTRFIFLASFALCIALFSIHIFVSVEFALNTSLNSGSNHSDFVATNHATDGSPSLFSDFTRILADPPSLPDDSPLASFPPASETVRSLTAIDHAVLSHDSLADPIPFEIVMPPPSSDAASMPPHTSDESDEPPPESKGVLNVNVNVLTPDFKNVTSDDQVLTLYGNKIRASRVGVVSAFESPFRNVSSCSGILPDEAYQPLLRRRFSSISDLSLARNRHHRTLIIVPRFGVGNFFQSFLSAYVFALLSGRQLVLYQNGPDSNVLKALCEAFTCDHNFELIVGKSADEFKKFTQKFPYLIEYKRGSVQRNSLFKTHEVMYVFTPRTFNEFWLNDDVVYKCVNDALDCSSVWCVQSKAMASLLKGGPTPALFDIMREIIFSTKNTTFVMHPKKEYDSNLFKFDVALQVRTRSRSIEVGGKERCGNDRTCLKQEEEKIRNDDKKIAQTVFNELSWKCLGQVLLNIRKKLKQLRKTSKLKVFLATDSVALRPQLVEYLKPYGQVYFSTGSVVHTSKTKVGFALPTMSEFFLLSLSRNVISFQAHISTFGRAACLYTNRTLVSYNGVINKKCRFRVYHLGNGSEEEDFNIRQLVA